VPAPTLHHPAPSTTQTDEQLVRWALSGDLDAFGQLVRRHRDVVYRVAARIVGDADADDVTQDAFLRAFNRLGSFRGESPFRAWLLRITHNAALNALARRPKAQPTDLVEQAADTFDERPPPNPTPVEQLEVSERRERLVSKIALLSPNHRAVLALRDLEGLSYEEIAQVTDTPLGSVKGRLHRARGELIEILRHNTYDWELPR
jgi:RNA polymerase sigma-70 factor, ECF subfamily